MIDFVFNGIYNGERVCKNKYYSKIRIVSNIVFKRRKEWI